MPFKKGVATPGAGRKGFEIEQKELARMRKILVKDMAIVERLQDTKKPIDIFDVKRLEVSQARILKYADKLHATKESHELSGKVETTPDKQSIEKTEKVLERFMGFLENGRNKKNI